MTERGCVQAASGREEGPGDFEELGDLVGDAAADEEWAKVACSKCKSVSKSPYTLDPKP